MSFERVHNKYVHQFLGRIPCIMSMAIVALSVVRRTYLYLLGVVMIFFSLRLVAGGKAKTGPLLAAAASVTGIVAIIEALLIVPPLNALATGVAMTSMISLILSESPTRMFIPGFIGVSYYIAEGEYALALLTLAMAPLAYVTSEIIDRATGTSAIALLRGFVLARVSGNPRPFEKELAKLSSEERDLAHVLLSLEPKDNRNNSVAIVITEAHPGPIRGIGGALFFEVLTNELRKRGYLPLTLRGLGGHDNDLISSKDALLVAERILSELENGRPHCSCEPTLGISSNEYAKVLVLGLCKENVAFVIRKKPSFDDLPLSLRQLQDEYKVVLVDTHSYHGESRSEVDELVKQLRKLLEEALATERSCGPLRYGVTHVPGRSIDRQEREVGPFGLTTLVIECNQEKVGILLFDGNSMVPGLRDAIEKELIGLVDHVVIATTDSHAMVRIQSKWGYDPIGTSLDWRMIVEVARSSTKEAIGFLATAYVSLARVRTKAPVLGERGVSSLEKALAKAPLAAIALIVNLFLLPLALAIIIT